MRTLTLTLTVIVLLLAGCAPDINNYAGQPGAPQALNECRAQSWQIASNPGNPLMAGAMQSQFQQDCMRAKGYQMR